MARVKKRILALSRWTNQLRRVITCWCISRLTWSHDLNSYMVIWYKSQVLIYVCFKRWDKYVSDPYEATPWRNHTWDTNDSRSLLNYILFNLSIVIVVLSRGIQKEGWCLPKLKPLYSKAIFWKPKNSLKFYGWPWLGLRNLECSCWTAAELNFSWAELLQLQLSFSAELNFSWVELSQLQLNFNFNWGPGRFNRGPGQVQPGSREVQPVCRESSAGFFSRTSLVKTGWTGPRGGSTGVRVNWPVWPPDWQTDSQSDTHAVEPALGAVQPVSGPVFAVGPAVCQSDRQTDCQPAPGGWTGPRGGSTGPPQPKSVQQLVLKPHLYILTPTSLHTQEHDPNSISNLKNTSHSLSHISCLSHFKSLERNLWVCLRSAIFVLHLQISLALLHSSFGTTSSSLWIHYSWSF
jgi:hypothetical protein